jgi:hypothetical protein
MYMAGILGSEDELNSIIHAPEHASRFFTFGTEPAFGQRFVVALCKAAG